MSNPIIVTAEALASIIAQSKGKFISVAFVKRTTGELRQMTCRIGVTKYAAGQNLRYDPAAHGLISVWEVSRKHKGAAAYRMINVAGLMSAKIGGKTYIVA